MYAVIQTGGKQYRVQPGDFIQVEKLGSDVGGSVKFDQVLFLSQPGNTPEDSSQVWLGKPVVSGASVQAQVVGQGRGDKILIIKMKRRKQYRRTMGHRQEQTQLLVTSVDNGAGNKKELSAAEIDARMKNFHTGLTPKGQAFTPKLQGTRKKRIAAAAAASKSGEGKKASAKKTVKKNA